MAKTSTSFKKGESKGRPKGAVNKLTKTVKETVLQVFNELQDDPKNNLLSFAKKYPRDFYPIAAKLIPNEVNANVEVIKPKLPDWMKDES
jgi:hypothetical protein